MNSKVLLTLLAVLLQAACGDGNGGTDPPPVSTVFEGVIAGNDGVETGTLLLTLLSDGTGSGSFKIGSVTTTLTSVSKTNNQFSASGGGYTFSGVVSGIFIDGSYSSPGAGGLLAGAARAAQIQLDQYCGSHDGGAVVGVFAFVHNTSTNAVRGVWTSGPVSAFKGIVSGFATTDGGVMSGHPGTVNIVPDLQSADFAGTYDLTSGEQGIMSGPVCP